MVKNLAAMQETQVRFLGQEDPLEKDPLQNPMENPMNRGAWWATVHGGHKESDTTEVTNTQLYTYITTQSDILR